MSYGSYGDGGFYFLQPVDAEYGGVHYGRAGAGLGFKPYSRAGAPGTTKEIRVLTSDGLEVGKKRNTYKLHSAPTAANLDAYIGKAFSVGDTDNPIAVYVITQFEEAMAAKVNAGEDVMVVVEDESLLQRYRLPLLVAGGLGAAYLLYRRFM